MDLKELSIVQKAAKSKKAFHMNEALDGISLPSSNHLSGHNSLGGYNDTIRDVFTANQTQINSMNPDEAYDFLTGLANHIKSLIESNPNKNMGQIANLISYP